MMPLADILRAGGVAAAAVALATALLPIAGRRRLVAWCFLMAPYLAPALLVGYGYANFSLSLIRHPGLGVAAYAALLCLKLTPIAVLALHFTPRALSAEALHCERLARGSIGWAFRWRAGAARAPVTAFALVFLLAFSEFEMASLMNVRTWPVRVFDGHAGGLPLLESLRLAAGPFAIELAVLGAALALLARCPSARGTPPLPGRVGAARWTLLLAINLVVWGIPAAVALQGTWQGWHILAQSFALGREMATSMAFGAVAAAAAYAVAPHGWRSGVLLSLPGLLGPLVLAILIGALVQATALRPWRDTPVPLIAALVLVLLPMAVLLRQLLRRTEPAAATHAARLLGGPRGRSLRWDLSTRRHVWAIFLLLCLGYLDLTASAILAPIGITPVSVRLYNLMHYGRTSVLSAMVTAAFAAPPAALALVLATRRLWMRA